LSQKDPKASREAARYAVPIASREWILTLLDEAGKPLTAKQIAGRLSIDTAESKKALKSRLAAMLRSGQVSMNARSGYSSRPAPSLLEGTVSAHRDGFGFLVLDTETDDIYLSYQEMKKVLHGDRVQATLIEDGTRSRSQARIETVLERPISRVTGRIQSSREGLYVEPLSRSLHHPIQLEESNKFELSIGQIVEVELATAQRRGMFCGRIDKVLAEEMSPDVEIEVALRNHDIPFEFPEEVLAEVKAIKNHLNAKDLKHREDLRHLPFVTIDGQDAKDFDDAVFAESTGSGFRLWVAIADVAHYVTPGSPLETEAIRRGTSVYFPQWVVPMLPEKLSNGLCSLKPLEDRLAVVCVMDFDASGHRIAFRFLEAVIQSSARLIYEDVATCITDPNALAALGEPIAQNITMLLSVYQKLLERRAKRGALEIETSELNIEWDETGALSVMAQRVRTDAHKLIEECMLAANVAMADLIASSGQLGLYRVHDEPDAERVTRLASILAQFGIAFDADQAKVTTQDFQKVLDASRDQPAGAVLQMLILRTMNQAIYTPDRRQHFGLNYEGYAHFTSPIRRLADLMNHRLVKSVVTAERTQKQLKSPPANEEAGMQALGEQASLTERRADAAVFEVLEWLKCEYLKKYLGESFEGVITTAVKFGLFVNIEPMMAEGLIHVSSLADDHYRFDQDRGALIGTRSGRVFSLGDRVVVQIDRVDAMLGQVSLSLSEHRPLHRRGESSGRSPKKRGQKTTSGRAPSKRKRTRRG